MRRHHYKREDSFAKAKIIGLDNIGNNNAVFACLDNGIDNLMNRLNNENIRNSMDIRQRTLWNYINGIINTNL